MKTITFDEEKFSAFLDAKVQKQSKADRAAHSYFQILINFETGEFSLNASNKAADRNKYLVLYNEDVNTEHASWYGYDAVSENLKKGINDTTQTNKRFGDALKGLGEEKRALLLNTLCHTMFNNEYFLPKSLSKDCWRAQRRVILTRTNQALIEYNEALKTLPHISYVDNTTF